METPKEFMNRNGSGADECYWMLVEIGNGVEMDAIDKAMMAYAKYYHEQQVNSVDLADVGGNEVVLPDDVGQIEQLNSFNDWFEKEWYPEEYSHLAIKEYLKTI